jgi:hypothetical protein
VAEDKQQTENNKKKHTIKLETKVTLGFETSEFHVAKRRAAIKAALQSATAHLASTTSGLAAQAIVRADDDGGTPPWDEIIIAPIWYEKNATFGDILLESAELSFWD